MNDEEETEKMIKGTALLLGLALIFAGIAGATHWWIAPISWGCILILAAIVA
jgi:hypothetical protein